LSVETVTPTTAWISGGPTEGFVARTVDGGATWTQEALPSVEPVYSISGLAFLTADDGFATGHVGIWRRTA
jgi:photosystem II stability/assembly factor-like uncharacterized protein